MAKRHLDVGKLDNWLKENGRDRSWLANALIDEMKKSPRRRRRHAQNASSVETGINRWDTMALTPMYQTLLKDVTGGESENWYVPASGQSALRIPRDLVGRQDTNERQPGHPAERARTKSASKSPHRAPPARRRETLLDEVLWWNYPRKQYRKEFAQAAGLAITGTNLRRIVPECLDFVNDVLMRNGEVKVLMHNPDSTDLCRLAMIQDQGPWKNLSEYRKLVRTNLSAFCGMRAKYKKNGEKHKLQIKTMDYMPAFGLDLFDGVKTLYVRFYSLPDRSEDFRDKPIVRLTEGDGEWYRFFNKQFDKHWLADFAHEVPEDYPWKTAWNDLQLTLKQTEVSRLLGLEKGVS